MSSIPRSREDAIVIALELFIEMTEDSLAELPREGYTYRKLRNELRWAKEALEGLRKG
jgi:hypothetical protein